MKVIHHNDLDGQLSGYIVGEYSQGDKYVTEYIEVNYGYEPDIDSYKRDEKIVIVDFSFSPEVMDKICNKVGKENVVLIDHHKTAIEKFENYNVPSHWLLYDGIAGCMLTWCYFNSMISEDSWYIDRLFHLSMLEEDVPLYIKLVADHDVWNFKYGEETKDFVAGLYIEETDPRHVYNIWKELNDGFLSEEEICRNGELLNKYKVKQSEKLCSTHGFEAKLVANGEVYNCFCLNMIGFSSDVMDSVDGSKYDLFIGFNYDGSQFRYSVRRSEQNNGIDCAKIVEYYGGGGHEGAAGFSTDCMVLLEDDK